MAPPAATGRAPSAGLRLAVATGLAGKAVELVTLLLLATLVPRVLGPEAYGRFALPLTLVTVGSLATTLGGQTLLARYVPAAPVEERPAVAVAIGARLARGRAVGLAAVAVAATAAVPLSGGRLSALHVAMLVAALGLNVAATVALQVALGLGRAGPWSARYPLQNSVLVAAVLVLEPAFGTFGGLLAILVAAVAGAAFAAAVAAPVLAAARRAPKAAVPAGAVRFGTMQAVGAALVQATHRGGVVAVALLASGAAETGYAAMAAGVALGVTYAILQAFTVALPHLAGADTAPAEAALRRLAGALLAVLVPGAVTAALLVDDVIPAVLGDGYAGAVPAFGPALAVVVLAPLGALAVQSSALRLRPETALSAGIAAALAFAVGAVALVPAWGAAGATAATLAGVGAGAVVSVRSLPGAAGTAVTLASFAGAAAVLVASVLA